MGPKVEEDGIGFPVAGTDCSLVHTGDRRAVGTTGAEAVSFDVIRRDVSDVVDGASSVPQFRVMLWVMMIWGQCRES